MISIRNLRKSFDGFPALSGIDMNVKKGSIYGLVGTNGSGKTTILRLLNGIIKADDGDILIDDVPVYENPIEKKKLAFIPDDLSFFSTYNLKDVGRFFADIYKGQWDGNVYKEIINRFQLNPQTKISKFSKGMQKQAVFALSIASTPEYLILDEPIDGLDPIVRQVVWEYIVAASADRQMTTLVSSHNLREMEGFCDSIGIIHHGKMQLEKDLDELKSDIHKLQVSFGSGNLKPKDAYKELNIVHSQASGSVDILIVRNDAATLNNFRQEKDPVIFDMVPLTLEEVFIYELGGADDAIEDIL
jgi:ABC-2 type transport system ATP-binding protein